MAVAGRARLLAAAALLGPATAEAHAFGQLYNLPIPLWLYVFGTVAALLVSFLLIAWLSTAERGGGALPGWSPEWLQLLRRGGVLACLRGIALGLLVLTIASGWFGVQNAYANFSMTGFWILFLLGLTCISAVVGDVYGASNPWRTLARLIGRAWPGYLVGRRQYPAKLGHWPALLFFMGLVWGELYGRLGPRGLATVLFVYTVVTLGGVGWVGAGAWFRCCELFSVLFGLLARMAPMDWDGARLRLRAPLAGVTGQKAESYGVLVLMLFFLSSTTFDGLHATFLWYGAFWNAPLAWLQQHYGAAALPSYAVLRGVFEGFGSVCLFLSPFLYLAVYLGAIELARRLGGSSLTRRELALRFGGSLLPIALVYNLSHYFTLLLTQGSQVLRLLSDPFGFGWHLLGPVAYLIAPPFPNMALVWHAQVALILLGHIASVYLAHVEALALMPRRAAAISQLPMLALMMFLTGFGLWILALPLQGNA